MGRGSNKPLAFGADSDHDLDPGILTEFLQLRDRTNFKNFVGSAALAEVCALRVLLFLEHLAKQHVRCSANKVVRPELMVRRYRTS